MLSGGRVVATGSAGEVVDAYVGDVLSEAEQEPAETARTASASGKLRYTDLRLESGTAR